MTCAKGTQVNLLVATVGQAKVSPAAELRRLTYVHVQLCLGLFEVQWPTTVPSLTSVITRLFPFPFVPLSSFPFATLFVMGVRMCSQSASSDVSRLEWMVAIMGMAGCVKDARSTQMYSSLPASWTGDAHEETDFLPISDREGKDTWLLDCRTDELGTRRILYDKVLADESSKRPE